MTIWRGSSQLARDYPNSNKDTVQKLVNAYVSTLTWIQGHSAQQIADKMPADYYQGVGKDTYTAALNSEKGIFNPTGIMPADGPPTCLAVLSRSSRCCMASLLPIYIVRMVVGDRLRAHAHPARHDHHRQVLGQRPHQLE